MTLLVWQNLFYREVWVWNCFLLRSRIAPVTCRTRNSCLALWSETGGDKKSVSRVLSLSGAVCRRRGLLRKLKYLSDRALRRTAPADATRSSAHGLSRNASTRAPPTPRLSRLKSVNRMSLVIFSSLLSWPTTIAHTTNRVLLFEVNNSQRL